MPAPIGDGWPLVGAPVMVLAGRAKLAITDLCVTVQDAADEVSARGGKKVARMRLPHARDLAVKTVAALALAMPQTMLGALRRGELDEIATGCRDGYAREAWALRVVAIAAEVGK